jgi:di/tricarboxylate transporter
LTPDEAYEAVDWRVIFLLAGVLPLGLALERSGAATLLAGQVLGVVGKLGPVAALAALYLLTATLTEFMSNNAAAVLLAPVAISTAVKLGVDPKPLLLAVTFAASTSFATPVGYQTNTMIYNAGGYRFTDFLRVGIPLNLIFWVLAIVYIPRYWPF